MTLNLANHGKAGSNKDEWTVLESILWIATGDNQSVRGLGVMMSSPDWMGCEAGFKRAVAATAKSEYIEAYHCKCGVSAGNKTAQALWRRMPSASKERFATSLLRECAEDRWCDCYSQVAQLLLSSLNKGLLKEEGADPFDWGLVTLAEILAGNPGKQFRASRVRTVFPTGWKGKGRLSPISGEELDAFLIEHKPRTNVAYDLVMAAFPEKVVTKREVAAACKRVFPNRTRGRPRNIPQKVSAVIAGQFSGIFKVQ